MLEGEAPCEGCQECRRRDLFPRQVGRLGRPGYFPGLPVPGVPGSAVHIGPIDAVGKRWR